MEKKKRSFRDFKDHGKIPKKVMQDAVKKVTEQRVKEQNDDKNDNTVRHATRKENGKPRKK